MDEAAVPECVRNHGLFQDHFLRSRLAPQLSLPSGDASGFPHAAAANRALAKILDLWSSSRDRLSAGEDAVTDFVKRVCEELGMVYSGQARVGRSGASSQRVDIVLFESATAAARFAKSVQKGETASYTEALAAVEVKQLGAALDKTSYDNTNPSYQIVQYLTFTGLPWGILTDGARWRLCRRFDPPRFNSFVEVDLGAILSTTDRQKREEAFRWFYFFFSRRAFEQTKQGAPLDQVLEGNERHAVEVQDALRAQAYPVVESLARGIHAASGKPSGVDLRLLYQQAIVILYRLLFIKFAEDRGILPPQAGDLARAKSYRQAYDQIYGFSKLQDDLISLLDRGVPLGDNPGDTRYWNALQGIFEALDRGQPSAGIPVYNGKLFKPERLAGVAVTDGHLAHAVDQLARVTTGGKDRLRVDYRYLEVRHLGSIYEGLLEQQLERDGDSVRLVRARGGGERHSTGSYYTPDPIVWYIVTQAIDPICAGKSAAEIEQIKVLDPAMGSGHFVVVALSRLALHHAGALRREAAAASGKGGEGLIQEASPTEEEIAGSERRLVERCIYGVDVNDLAVELAQLALWLSTLSADRPLFFLDHHLRWGNSLVGTRLADLGVSSQTSKKQRRVERERRQAQDAGQVSMFGDEAFRLDVSTAVVRLGQIEEEGDRANVRAQEELHRRLRQELNGKYGRLTNLLAATQLGLGVGSAQWTQMAEYAMGQKLGVVPQLEEVLKEADRLSEDRKLRFFHWELEFPEVFFDERGNRKPDGGFDVVLGNPPYVRAETLGSVFKGYAQSRFATFAGTADLYTYFIEQGLALLKPGGRLSFIVSSSWLKANYGKSLRCYLRSNTTVESLVDLGDNRVFADAPDVYTSIPVIVNARPPANHCAWVAVFSRGDGVDLSAGGLSRKLTLVSIHDQPDEGWRLETNPVRKVFAKVTAGCSPLSEHCNGEICYGIKTGLNEVFVIDSGTRDRLIAEDPACASIIKPVIKGENIRPWFVESEDRWLIFARRGIDIGKYPSVREYLGQFKSRLEPRPQDWDADTQGHWPGRKPGSYRWYELQDSVDYYEAFERPKILWPDICRYPRFAFDSSGLYLTNTGYVMPVDDLWLLGFLSSRVAWFIISQTSIPLGERAGMNRYRLIDQYMRKLPVPDPFQTQKDAVAETARGLTTAASERHGLHRATRHRIACDLGAKGSKLNRRLTEWWDLPDFRAFRAEVRSSFDTDVPVRERTEWEAYLQLQQTEHRRLTEKIVLGERRLNDLVYSLYGLTREETELIEAATKYPYGQM